MTRTVIVLPLVLPIVSAAVSILARRRLALQRKIAVIATTGILIAGILLLVNASTEGPTVLHVGGWMAPFGITLVADILGSLMVVLAGLTGIAVAIYSIGDIEKGEQELGYFPLYHVLLLGVCGAFLTGDLFNLYVWFEVMLMGSFILLAMGGGRGQIEGALKYVTINLLSSAIFLAAVGLTYATAKTLNMADLSRRMPLVAAENPGLANAITVLFIVGFGIKAGLFPFFFWLPSSYHTPPASVSAIFAGLLTKVGVYALIRVFTLVLPVTSYALTLLLVLSVVTMLSGVLGAVSHFEIRRILSFHIISQIGYMVLGLALIASPDPRVRELGLAAAVFYIAHHIVVKTNLFLLGGTIRLLQGSYDLKKVGGLFRWKPWLAVLFFIPAFSLAGIPPLSGFWAKLSVIRAGLAAGEYAAVAVALFAGLLTMISMVKIWNEAFWKPAPSPDSIAEPSRECKAKLGWLVAPSVLLAAVTLAIGLFPQPLFHIAEQSAHELTDPEAYVRAVELEDTASLLPPRGEE